MGRSLPRTYWCSFDIYVQLAPEVSTDCHLFQSKHFSNIFAAGDCMNTPNAKTAAAVSSHLKTIEKNLGAVLEGKEPPAKVCARILHGRSRKTCSSSRMWIFQYDGYASCPLIVGRRLGILAEFNSKGPMETLPINQSTPRWVRSAVLIQTPR